MLPQLGHDIMAYLAFALYVLLIIGGGLTAVLARNLVRAMIGLVVTFLGVAGMYLLMASPFLAFMQLLIYIGAVSVLIFFALMLADAKSDGDEAAPAKPAKLVRSILSGLAPLVLLTPPIFAHPASTEWVPAAVTVADIGRGLMEEYVLPFELISIILLISMAGGVFLAMDRRKK